MRWSACTTASQNPSASWAGTPGSGSWTRAHVRCTAPRTRTPWRKRGRSRRAPWVCRSGTHCSAQRANCLTTKHLLFASAQTWTSATRRSRRSALEKHRSESYGHATHTNWHDARETNARAARRARQTRPLRSSRVRRTEEALRRQRRRPVHKPRRVPGFRLVSPRRRDNRCSRPWRDLAARRRTQTHHPRTPHLKDHARMGTRAVAQTIRQYDLPSTRRSARSWNKSNLC